jgi:hypothetical protein
MRGLLVFQDARDKCSQTVKHVPSCSLSKTIVSASAWSIFAGQGKLTGQSCRLARPKSPAAPSLAQHRCHLKPASAPDLTIVAHMPQSTAVVDGQILPLAVSLHDIVALPKGREPIET